MYDMYVMISWLVQILGIFVHISIECAILKFDLKVSLTGQNTSLDIGVMNSLNEVVTKHCIYRAATCTHLKRDVALANSHVGPPLWNLARSLF